MSQMISFKFHVFFPVFLPSQNISQNDSQKRVSSSPLF